MWEPGAGSNGSTTSTNRGIFLLISVCLALVILYKAWGPLLIITFALVLVVHTCYSLLVNDSLLAPHSFVLLHYASQLGLEVLQAIKLLAALGYRHSLEVFQSFKQWYHQRKARSASALGLIAEQDMNRRSRNVYRLSTSGTELPEGISPIHNDPYHSIALNGACDVARTSTPLPRGMNLRKGIQQNGEIGLFTPIINSPAKKLAQLRSENKQPSIPLESRYNPQSSHYGDNISPKMRDKNTVKTVQTVAGPLLASTRYNIDPKTYTDINSPGLTSRLTKYATEANNKLTHQPQYGTGQFPKVNLNATPTPLLSPKVVRARIPVTVRVAPPEVVNYSPIDGQSQQERHKLYSGSEAKESQSCPNVAQVLKKISLKRHASREDIMFDIAKKQRAERIYIDQLENLEEMMQKRARDESMTSEDEQSPQSKNQRPLKRPKASSCHDILNSLSSSIHVFTGVKRKAMDTSRCNTPDIEKHFKSSSRSPNSSSSAATHSSGDSFISKEQLNVIVPAINASGEPFQTSEKISEKSPETSKTNNRSPENQKSFSPKTSETPTLKEHREIPTLPKSMKLTDKLFMKPDPQNNEKLKNLIEEQGNVEVKFTTDDKDEIKKQDIYYMRQNSMRLRLQSMFDAISGKSASKIDPDVVIQAEEVRPSIPTNYTSLNSQTTTTTVNTSPITTTIVPILKGDNKSKSPHTKHVTFDLSTASSVLSSTPSTLSNTEVTTVISKPVSESLGSGISSGFGSFSTASSTSSTSVPSFNFGTSSLATSTSVTSVKSAATGGLSFSSSAIASSTASVPISKISSPEIKTTVTMTNTKISSSLIAPKTTLENVNTTSVISSSGFSFGSTSKSTTAPTMPSAPTALFTSIANTAPTKSTESNAYSSPIPTFGNALSKSPASTSLSQPTSTLPNFTAQKKEGATGFSFGTSSSIPNLSSAPSGPTPITSQSTSLFGMSAASTPTFSLGSNTTTVSSAVGSSSGSTVATTTSIFTFGSGATAKPTPSFSFKSTQNTLTPSCTSTPSGGFGTPTLSTANSSGTTVTFAVPAASNAMSNPTVTAPSSGFGNATPSLFGAPTNSPSLFSGAVSTSAPSTSMFKSPATTASTTPNNSIFGTPAGTTPSFGSSLTATTASSTPSLFGTNNATPSLFGTAATSPTTTATATPTMSAFGGTGVQQQQTPQGGGIFSGVNMNAPTGTNSIFGSANTTPTSSLFSGSTTASSSNNNLPTATSSAESTSIFGQPKPVASMSFGATNSAFGTSQTSSSFAAPNTSSTSTFQLGSAASASSTSGGLPSFSAIKPTAQFGVASNAPTTNATSIFGSSTTSAGFGSNTAPSAFGSVTPASGAQTSGFGMQNNTNVAPPAFGASVASSSSFGGGATTTSPFGSQSTTSSTSPFGTQATTSSTSPFGTQATTSSTTLFGNAAPAASTSSSFSFGGSQPTQQPTQQPTASFSFGGATNANAVSSGGLFQFGAASTAPKPGGFNFNPPTAAPTINFTGGATQGAPPAFNAPATNMFSIGSGSSTPRTRPSRTRRQR